MKQKKMLALGLSVLTVASLLAGCGSSDSENNVSQQAADTATTDANEATSSTAATESTTEAEESKTAEATDAGSGEQVTIQFMHDWPEYETQFDQMVEDFEAANPDIKVETQIITWDVLTETLTTDFASGEVPDVACCWANQMGAFNSLNAVYDLTPYMEENNSEWKNSLLKPAVQLGTVDGKIFCVPFRTTCTVLAYNKTMMEKNGWEVPTTLEEMEDLMDQVVAKGITPILAPGNPHGFQMASIIETFAMDELYKSGKLTTSEYLTGHMTDVADEYTAAGTKMRDWLDKGYVNEEALAMTREDSTAQFYQQKGLFAFVNNNELADVEKNAKEAGFEVSVMAFPTPKGLPSLLYNFGVDGFMVYSGTQYPEQSARFLKYITSKDVQQKFGIDTLSVMANSECSYENENQNKFSEIFSSAESYRINYDYNSGNLASDQGDIESEFVSDPSMTPEEFGQQIEELRKNCLEENGNG